MTLILSDSEMGAGIASKLLGQLAERASVCAMVIDRTGRVVAINRGGLERLSATRDEVISQPWSTLWDGSHREAARAALERALSGEAVTEALPRAGETPENAHDVDIAPFEQSGQVVSLALAVTDLSRARTTENAEVMQALREAAHAISNVANVNASSARLLERISDDEAMTEIAKGLREAAGRAERTVEALSRIVVPDDG
ncbi:MAG: hypothetical protein CML50_05735 [Rhodobacteraceae bacterium]|jgi:PAS domain S-box-containing protein|nr:MULTISPECIES: PAS domain-containing protein [Salipiger]MAB05502.1 hypothetical protein [Paracoccaceae bacterium]GGA15769.1 hypothetical protein GCM10011326_30320 [Salipiger profundus]SFD09277.1 PAS domain S-box-containing protein [Salipiger profundus]